jgi:hypothetical protein
MSTSHPSSTRHTSSACAGTNVVSVLGSAPYLFIRPEQGEVAGDGSVWIFYSGHARGREAHYQATAPVTDDDPAPPAGQLAATLTQSIAAVAEVEGPQAAEATGATLALHRCADLPAGALQVGQRLIYEDRSKKRCALDGTLLGGSYLLGAQLVGIDHGGVGEERGYTVQMRDGSERNTLIERLWVDEQAWSTIAAMEREAVKASIGQYRKSTITRGARAEQSAALSPDAAEWTPPAATAVQCRRRSYGRTRSIDSTVHTGT